MRCSGLFFLKNCEAIVIRPALASGRECGPIVTFNASRGQPKVFDVNVVVVATALCAVLGVSAHAHARAGAWLQQLARL
jgi:hypothetical protein